MDFSNISYSKDGFLVTITLNRQEALNALNQEMIGELGEALLQIQRDKDVRVVILTGAGRAFCAGADLGILKNAVKANDRRELILGFNRLILNMRNLEKPLVAAVNGVSIGAGCCLAIACDLVVAAEGAKFGFAFTQVGLSQSDLGATYLLPRIVGLTRATKILLLGEMVDAKEAEQYGLANKVVPSNKLMEATRELAEKIADNPPIGLAVTKFAINKGLGLDLNTDLEYETYLQTFCMETEDHLIGLESILGKEKPSYKGF